MGSKSEHEARDNYRQSSSLIHSKLLRLIMGNALSRLEAATVVKLQQTTALHSAVGYYIVFMTGGAFGV